MNVSQTTFTNKNFWEDRTPEEIRKIIKVGDVCELAVCDLSSFELHGKNSFEIIKIRKDRKFPSSTDNYPKFMNECDLESKSLGGGKK